MNKNNQDEIIAENTQVNKEEEIVATMITPYGLRGITAKEFHDVQDEYGYYYDENERKRVFGVVGKKNLYEDILSHKDATDIRYIKEVLLNGGAPELTDEMFGDISSISPDLLDNLQKAELGRDMFNNLPVEIRQKYGNDIYKFAMEYKQEDLLEYVKSKNSKPIEKKIDKDLKVEEDKK